MKKQAMTLPRALKRMFPNVDTVHDATQSIEVIVNAKDCKDATKMNPAECALARATKRELNADGAIVGLSTSYIIKGNEAIRFQTPDSVQREIVSFDRHHDFAPGIYYLTPKSPTGSIGYIRGSRKGGGKNKTAKREIHHSARVRLLP